LKLQVDLNCDLGEGYGAFRIGRDAEIMSFVSSANIACGFHAGDPLTMAQTIHLAKNHSVAAGAHPGYPDLLGFGRREMRLTMEEVEQYTVYQIGALQGIAQEVNVRLQHVKPHGALYNVAARDEETARGIVNAVKVFSEDLIVLAPSKSMLAKESRAAGLRVAQEFFADRGYNRDGSLVSRRQPNAIIKDPEKLVERAVEALVERQVLAVDGSVVDIGEVHTICVHGDTPNALCLAEALKKGLIHAGVEVKPLNRFL
jgi:UPF0271 protein